MIYRLLPEESACPVDFACDEIGPAKLQIDPGSLAIGNCVSWAQSCEFAVIFKRLLETPCRRERVGPLLVGLGTIGIESYCLGKIINGLLQFPGFNLSPAAAQIRRNVFALFLQMRGKRFHGAVEVPKPQPQGNPFRLAARSLTPPPRRARRESAPLPKRWLRR